MNPGDVLVCACGARSAPLWHTGVWHKEGWPLLATWERRTVLVQAHGEPWSGICPACDDAGQTAPERPSIEAAAIPSNVPQVDLHDLDGRVIVEAHQAALPAEAYARTSSAGEGPFRVEPGDRSGSSSSVQKAPLERSTWCLDEPGPVPSWLKGYGGTSRAYLEKRYGAGAHFHRNGGVSDDTAIGAALPLASRDALRTLELPERFEELAREYRAETGRWPYGYPFAAVPPGDSIDREHSPWIAWCRSRNAAAAPKREPAKPKGQLGLGL